MKLQKKKIVSLEMSKNDEPWFVLIVEVLFQTNILWLQFLNLLLFFVYCDNKLNSFGLGLFVRQNEQVEDITMGFRKLWCTFFIIS